MAIDLTKYAISSGTVTSQKIESSGGMTVKLQANKEVTENGNVKADLGYDGILNAIVNVQGGGGEGKHYYVYISSSNLGTYGCIFITEEPLSKEGGIVNGYYTQLSDNYFIPMNDVEYVYSEEIGECGGFGYIFTIDGFSYYLYAMDSTEDIKSFDFTGTLNDISPISN